MPPSNKEGEKNKELEILANKIMNRLRLERKIIGDEAKKEVFVKVSEEIFREEGIPKENYPDLKHQIGKILNWRKIHLLINKYDKERKEIAMINGAKELEKENTERGITPDGDSDTEIMEEKEN